jgi:hypothetical protein
VSPVAPTSADEREIEEFREKLRRGGIPSHAYSLEGGMPDEALVLDSLPGGRWTVYFSERGQRMREREFAFLDDALQDMADQLKVWI